MTLIDTSEPTPPLHDAARFDSLITVAKQQNRFAQISVISRDVIGGSLKR